MTHPPYTHTHKSKFKGHSVQKTESKQTDEQTDRWTDAIPIALTLPPPAKTVAVIREDEVESWIARLSTLR